MPASQYLVLGVHRSGTSLLTATVAKMGVFVGDESDIDAGDRRWNEKGYWEHGRVRSLDEEILEACDTTWFGVTRFRPEDVPEARRLALTARARAIVESLDRSRPWVVKDPRLCLLLPFWKPLLGPTAYLFSLRRPLSVARSLRARDGFPLLLGLAIWETHLCAAITATRGFPRLAVWYEDLMSSPLPTETLRAWLQETSGGAIRPGPLPYASPMRPELCHHVSDAEETAALPTSTRVLLDALLSGEAFSDGFEPKPSELALEVIEFTDKLERTKRLLERGLREQQLSYLLPPGGLATRLLQLVLGKEPYRRVRYRHWALRPAGRS